MFRLAGFVIVVAASVLAQAQSKSQGQKPKQTSLWAAISVPQPIFEEGGDTERLQVNFGVVNDGHSTVNPNVALSENS